MNLPTALTLTRIFLVPVFMALVLQEAPYGAFFAAVVFGVAAITDGLDGYIARSTKQVTKFGQFIDPIADKLLVTAALVTLVSMQEISAWLVMIILGREFAVSGLRMVVAAEGVVMPASPMGKVKTVTQIVGILAVLMNLPFGNVILWVAAVITVVSGIDYFVKSLSHF